MTELKVKIEMPNEEPAQQQIQPDKAVQPINKNVIKMNMKIRRSLDGNAMIYDHDNIDIVVSSKKLKVVAFAKGDFSDFVYASQNRMFEFLVKKGIIGPETIKGGHVYGSIEGTILKPLEDNIPLDQIVILNIGKWIEEERPHMEFDRQYDEEFTDHMTEPDDMDSTQLGEVPQEEEKGSISRETNIRRYTGY